MKKTYFYLTIFSLIIFIGQLLSQTDIQIAFLFSIAIFFGLSAVFASGKWNSTFGLLNLSLLVKFLLFGVVVKTIFLQPSDSPLLAPKQTAIVSALGFAGVLLGTLIQRILPLPKTRLIYTIYDKNFYLALYVFLFTIGYVSWFYVSLSRQGITDIASAVGGVSGILGQFGLLKEFSISAAIYYAYLSKSKRLLSHPLVIFTLVVSILVGIYSTSKQAMLEPLLYLILTTLILKGFRYKPLLIILTIVPLIYITLIYPYSQYIRNAGGREGNTVERIAVVSDVLPKMVLDEEYRSIITTSLSKSYQKNVSDPYLPIASDTLGRLAMVSEADKLIAASLHSEQTGWKTINWGFNMVLPRFINSDKPIFAPNNYFAHIVGDLGARDYITQVSYGFMANFYNAFGLIGVFVGSTLLISSLYYWLSLFFGNSTNINIWGILVFAEYNHPLTEQAVAGVISSAWFPVIAWVIFIISRYIAKKLR